MYFEVCCFDVIVFVEVEVVVYLCFVMFVCYLYVVVFVVDDVCWVIGVVCDECCYYCGDCCLCFFVVKSFVYVLCDVDYLVLIEIECFGDDFLDFCWVLG